MLFMYATGAAAVRLCWDADIDSDVCATLAKLDFPTIRDHFDGLIAKP